MYKRQATVLPRRILMLHLIISLHFSTMRSLNLLLSFKMAFCISFFSLSLWRILLYLMYFSYRISYSLVIYSLICCWLILLCSSILIINSSFIDLFWISCSILSVRLFNYSTCFELASRRYLFVCVSYDIIFSADSNYVNLMCSRR